MALEPDALKKLIGLHPLLFICCLAGRNIHGILEAAYEEDIIQQYQLRQP